MDTKAWNRLSSEIQPHLKAILEITKRYEIEHLNMYAIASKHSCVAFTREDGVYYNVDTVKPTIYGRATRL